MKAFLSIVAVFGGLLSLTGAAVGQEEAPRNLALGRSVVFAPAPNYALTAKGGTDASDLTDGKLTSREDRRIWFDSEAVGWSYAGAVQLAVDLGQVSSVYEVAVRLLGGSPQAQINFPVRVEVFAAKDAERYVKIGECSRWSEGDFETYEVPEDEGEAWIHRLRFKGLDTEARWIGLRMYTTGLTAADELEVVGRPTPAASASLEGERGGFSIAGPVPYIHKPSWTIATNLPLPQPIGLIVPESVATDDPMEITLYTPPGIEVVAGLDDAARERLKVGCLRCSFTCTSRASTKVLRRLYLKAPGLEAGHAAKIALLWRQGERSGRQFIPFEVVTVPKVPQPKRLLVGLGWWNVDDTAAWPEVLETWKHLGINSFPLFAHWMKSDDPAWELAAEARRRGFKIVNIDSTLHRMLGRRDLGSEVYCQFEDGTPGTRLCPSYRGRFYQQEVERFARQMARANPDFCAQDIEIWGWRGPVDCERCTRCRDAFARSGCDSWDAWRVEQGDAIWKELNMAAREAIERAGGDPHYDAGGYDFRPGAAYQGVWSFDRLYPESMQSSQVSTYSCLYPYHLALIGDEVRKDREQITRSDVLPWITPGDAGTFPGEALQWALLECYTNGARGVYFWSGRVWDAESLMSLSRVAGAVARVEDLILDGRLVGDSVRAVGAGRVSGVRRGDEMLLLVADYQGETGREVEIRADLPAASRAVDLLDEEAASLDFPAGASTIAIPLGDRRARLLHVRPKSGT